MTATVEQAKGDLVKMIQLVNGGEDIVITDEGRPVARLTGISPETAVNSDRTEWLQRLRRLRAETSTGKMGRSSEAILAEDREERN